MHGFANVMLIKCRFLMCCNLRGRERNFLLSGKYRVFCIPREKGLAIKKENFSLLFLFDCNPNTRYAAELVVFESSSRLTTR